MNPQEAQMLQNFLNQLVQARNVQKDPEAETLIANAVARQPDAAYLLVQRAMLMEQALDAAKSQIAALQNQVQSAQTQNRGFLDSANAWGNHPAPGSRPAPAPVQPAYANAPQYQSSPAYQPPPPPQYAAPAPSPGFLGGRAGSFLGSAAATAAGVAGGAFLFQGIESLLGHHGGGSGFMNPQQAGAFNEPVENTTINNYYVDDNSAADRNDRNDFSSDQNDYIADNGSDYSPDPGSDDDSFI